MHRAVPTRRSATLVLAILVLAILAPASPAQVEPAIDLVAPVDGPIVRHFEPPPDRFSPGHRGLDFSAADGSIVVASSGGVVAFAGQVGGSLFVSIDHPGGLRSTYSFLSAIRVTAGQAVSQGEPVAASGPGHGDHAPNLHFGLRSGDDYLDPEPLLLAGLRRDLARVVSLAPASG